MTMSFNSEEQNFKKITEKFEGLVKLKYLPSSLEIVTTLSQDLKYVNFELVSENCTQIDAISKSENEKLDEISKAANEKVFIHYEWSLLAGRLCTLQLKRKTNPSFSQNVIKTKTLYNKEWFKFVEKNSEELDKIIDTQYDWNFNILGIKTLLKSYLLKFKNNSQIIDTVETPQFLYLRVASFLWYEDFGNDKIDHLDLLEEDTVSQIKEQRQKNMIKRIRDYYLRLARGEISQASPTQFNAALKRHQLASCFLLRTGDNMQSISKSWKDCAIISMNTGGIGITFDETRHSEIGNTGYSDGIVPWIRILNNIMLGVNQGSKRRGSANVNICMWHRDAKVFIDLKKATGVEELRARDLFYTLMVSDEFMRRVENDEEWLLICPNKTNELYKLYGAEFKRQYEYLIDQHKKGNISPGTSELVSARELWYGVLNACIETGAIFIMFKDAINRKNNQANLGTIRMTNLCTEIVEYVDEKEIASCNLCSIVISKCVLINEEGKNYFSFEKLEELMNDAVDAMKQIINRNYYPEDIPEIKYSNMKNRPIGIGVQDLAGCFAKLDMVWGTDNCYDLNKKIAMHMYYYGMKRNVELAKIYGTYDSYEGCPASLGYFQFDLWGLEECMKQTGKTIYTCSVCQPGINDPEDDIIKKEDWQKLRKDMLDNGLYFSLMFAQMPTASTAHILGNNESIEPMAHNIFTKDVLSGKYVVLNKHMIDDLVKIGMWNQETASSLLKNNGSIQHIEIPEELHPGTKFRLKHLMRKYKTAFEIKQSVLAKMYLDRAVFQCQTTSNNVFMVEPTKERLHKYLYYVWSKGGKTGMYYLRQTATVNPIDFSIDAVSKTLGTQVQDYSKSYQSESSSSSSSGSNLIQFQQCDSCGA